MAIISKGILGGFSGKVGTVVGANWRGKDIIRSVPKRSKRKPTDAQILQRMKFAKVVDFLQPIRGIINQYFGGNSGYRSRYNEATSYILKNALEMDNDLPVVVAERVLITKGDLMGLQQLTLTVGGTSLQADWQNNAGQGNAETTDLVNLVGYCEENGLYLLFEEVAQRDSESITLEVPEYFEDKELDMWYFLNTEQKNKASTSMYIGKYTIA